eukprot:TRINITY_DN23470_c0_g1_i1.p1 TRINITY_DN23470_c0_g1~~TRINITY_DN23470_c0_g1_i1.p1  ORF type:complete len:305 (+),score=95.26 TRINITY_DN23470_c0_g1_i1:73-915(+)
MPCLVPASTPSSVVAEVLAREGVEGVARLAAASSGEGSILDTSPLEREDAGRGAEASARGRAARQQAAYSMNEGSRCGKYLIPEREDGEGDARLCVVLDLDETLIYNRAQCMLTASNEVVHRPHLQEFLCALSATCEVVLWTASTAEVAAGALHSIDPFQRLFDHVITRTPRWFTGVPYQKDLALLGRPLDRCVVVENNPDCVTSHSARAVIVQDFRAVPTPAPDLTLLVVLEVLEEISQAAEPAEAILPTCCTLTHRRREGHVIHEVPENCKPLYMPLD